MQLWLYDMTCLCFSLSLIAILSCNFSKPLGLTSAGGCAAWPSSGAACNKFPSMNCRNFLKNVLENQKLFSIQQNNHSFAKQSSHAYKVQTQLVYCYMYFYDDINLSWHHFIYNLSYIMILYLNNEPSCMNQNYLVSSAYVFVSFLWQVDQFWVR